MWSIIKEAADWTSVKLCGASVTFLFIDLSKLTLRLGIVVMATTIIYNVIKIYKELKTKK